MTERKGSPGSLAWERNLLHAEATPLCSGSKQVPLASPGPLTCFSVDFAPQPLLARWGSELPGEAGRPANALSHECKVHPGPWQAGPVQGQGVIR